jgi:hypothetical protein
LRKARLTFAALTMTWADARIEDTNGMGMSGASFIASSSAVYAFDKSSETVELFVACPVIAPGPPDVGISFRASSERERDLREPRASFLEKKPDAIAFGWNLRAISSLVERERREL